MMKHDETIKEDAQLAKKWDNEQEWGNDRSTMDYEGRKLYAVFSKQSEGKYILGEPLVNG